MGMRLQVVAIDSGTVRPRPVQRFGREQRLEKNAAGESHKRGSEDDPRRGFVTHDDLQPAAGARLLPRLRVAPYSCMDVMRWHFPADGETAINCEQNVTNITAI